MQAALVETTTFRNVHYAYTSVMAQIGRGSMLRVGINSITCSSPTGWVWAGSSESNQTVHVTRHASPVSLVSAMSHSPTPADSVLSDLPSDYLSSPSQTVRQSKRAHLNLWPAPRPSRRQADHDATSWPSTESDSDVRPVRTSRKRLRKRSTIHKPFPLFCFSTSLTRF